jgi:hypothetical protein
MSDKPPDNVTRMPTPWERQRDEFARAFRARKACQHTPITNPRVVENIVSVLAQLPAPKR